MYTFFSRLWARGQEELKPAGLRAQVRCGRRVKAGSAGKNCPGGSLSPFQSPARDPTATPCRVLAGQGAGRCPCRTAARGGGEPGTRTARASEFCVHAGPSAGEVLIPNRSGRRKVSAGPAPSDPARSAVSPRRGWKEMANSPATPTATPGDGEFPLRWRLAPPRTRKSPRPAGQGSLVKERQLGRWET